MNTNKNILVLILFMIASSLLGQSISLKKIKPPYLQKGDTIIILAPAGILKNRALVIDKAKMLAEKWGLKVLYGKHMFEQGNHFAGTDEQRCEDFQKALDDPTIKAIWSARGGYGSVRILDRLDFTIFKKHPKWIIGYSDLTAFHNHINNVGVETLHAMMGVSLEDKAAMITETIATFKKALFGEQLKYEVGASRYNRKGKVSGELVGGNIAVLASMLGSESQLDTDGKILFIEEIGEYKYSIDRMLQSLRRAGYFRKLKGVIVGGMTKIKKNTTPWGSSIEQLILDIIPENIPVMFNFPAGHDSDNRALILGRKVVLEVEENKALLLFEE
ncbi:S66 peptidase family protein [Tenacibaculum maritimum]|uniref:S66 peptidase family protein n=1 Tax=Tenacibaculum maritimum TaxID=107401 RepID=UPI0012E5D3EC|nr:LD-carboxypeptidase [Tenacibaculum maritimum]MCD9581448.1 LD-carboxypeptidase [Tenacibaculum maritimum]MCD9635762.1 LD-carboxypeptidase [Tenacibaculum maritimum]CAA0158714.1 LD-carboxypeptidase [Tenacibaculum maritimum]CAA0165768.1 LD-carboxypeptidase [Tenacibaculum maritimum]CAA0167761.1 LD-carboxypeptidase [Tenacibaculum maritimum]